MDIDNLKQKIYISLRLSQETDRADGYGFKFLEEVAHKLTDDIIEMVEAQIAKAILEARLDELLRLAKEDVLVDVTIPDDDELFHAVPLTTINTRYLKLTKELEK